MSTVIKVVDLSLVLDDDTQVYPGDPQPRFTVATRIETEGYNLLAVEIGSQSGTHVDSPYHFLGGGFRLEDCDPSLFVGAGVIVDARHLGPREQITWELVSRYEPQMQSGSIVVLHTGWSEKHYGTGRYFDHPFLDGDACAHMLEAGVRTFAIDAINLDETVLDERDPDFTCHLQIAAAGGIISENLTNLSAVDMDGPLISLLPIRFGGDADGAPCRAVAMQVGEGR